MTDQRLLILQQITASDFLFFLCKILLKSLIKLFLWKSILGKVLSKSMFTVVKLISKSILKIQDNVLKIEFCTTLVKQQC